MSSQRRRRSRCSQGSGSAIVTRIRGSRTTRASRRASRCSTFRGNAVLERSAAVVRRRVAAGRDCRGHRPARTKPGRVNTSSKGDFEVAMIQFTASDPDPALSRDFWVSSGSSHFWNSEQKTPGTDWERQIDDLMAKQAATMDDQERRRLFNDVQRIFAENLPIIYFAAPRVFIGTSARLTNLHPSLTRPPLMWSVDTMAVKPAADNALISR